ncbi:IS21/IS408/IS1162 family transposase, partial [Bacillus thuringiensis]|uniref:IS21/IS408/IS1162 family transposase n=1 Tax=Bacillus thuringiensis TaxID=1428 RepID=UPI003CFD9DBB
MASTKVRTKKLDAHKEEILCWLEEHPDLSAAQIHDWLTERYPSLSVGESTVRLYVSSLREDYQIPKILQTRKYEAIPDPPMGHQAQVVFGTCTVTTENTVIRLWFITFVLAHSRYKYVEWLDRPFTIKDVIHTHETAFQFFGGMRKEMVYDQDILISKNENAGDLILTTEFQQYVNQRKFKVHLCRKADPESKGKIENVVGYIKKNFAKHRKFMNVEKWNEQCWKWLERTGNGKIHNTTKKKPSEMHTLEKAHLQPISSLHNSTFSIIRTVRKDNTIRFQSNHYSVPLGTYQHMKNVLVYLTVTPENELIIHTAFEDSQQALDYLNQVRQNYPCYIRDQLQLITNIVERYPSHTVLRALAICIAKKLYSANDLKDVVVVLEKRGDISLIKHNTHVLPLSLDAHVAHIQAEKRPVGVICIYFERKRWQVMGITMDNLQTQFKSLQLSEVAKQLPEIIHTAESNQES